MKYLKTYQIFEARVPRSERIELYRDDDIVVVVPLTHRALQKYATKCAWCINSDIGEWEDYWEGKCVLIIQRNRKEPEDGITGNSKTTELYWLSKLERGESSFSDLKDVLYFDNDDEFPFKNEKEIENYISKLEKDINNFDVGVVLYNGQNLFDCGNVELSYFNKTIYDIPYLNDYIIDIMDQYLISVGQIEKRNK